MSPKFLCLPPAGVGITIVLGSGPLGWVDGTLARVGHWFLNRYVSDLALTGRCTCDLWLAVVEFVPPFTTTHIHTAATSTM